MRKALIIASAYTLYACAPVVKERVVEVQVPVKCEAPTVPPAELEKITKEDSYEERLRKLIHNYGKLKEENILLRKALEVCR